MKKIIKQFVSRTQTENSETSSTFSAILKASYSSNYMLEVVSIKYVNGKIRSENTTHIYFDNFEELEKTMQFHYELCKNNLFTKNITITI